MYRIVRPGVGAAIVILAKSGNQAGCVRPVTFAIHRIVVRMWNAGRIVCVISIADESSAARHLRRREMAVGVSIRYAGIVSVSAEITVNIIKTGVDIGNLDAFTMNTRSTPWRSSRHPSP